MFTDEKDCSKAEGLVMYCLYKLSLLLPPLPYLVCLWKIQADSECLSTKVNFAINEASTSLQLSQTTHG